MYRCGLWVCKTLLNELDAETTLGTAREQTQNKHLLVGNPVSCIRQKLRIAAAERGELLRGLQQAKVFNDELAKVRHRHHSSGSHAALCNATAETVGTLPFC